MQLESVNCNVQFCNMTHVYNYDVRCVSILRLELQQYCVLLKTSRISRHVGKHGNTQIIQHSGYLLIRHCRWGASLMLCYHAFFRPCSLVQQAKSVTQRELYKVQLHITSIANGTCSVSWYLRDARMSSEGGEPPAPAYDDKKNTTKTTNQHKHKPQTTIATPKKCRTALRFRVCDCTKLCFLRRGVLP